MSEVRRAMLELEGQRLEVAGQKSWTRSQASVIIGQTSWSVVFRPYVIRYGQLDTGLRS